MQKTSFLSAIFLAILLSGCDSKSTFSEVYVEMEMLNPPTSTEVLHDVDRYVSLEDSSETWNPFNHENNAFEAVLRYQYVYSDESILSDSVNVEVKGHRADNSGKKTVSALFSTSQADKEAKVEKRYAFDMGDIEVDLMLGGYPIKARRESGFQINYSFNLLEGGYGSGETNTVGMRLIYPNTYDVNHFVHVFPGNFKKGGKELLPSDFEIGHIFADSMGAEQVAVIKQNPSGLQVRFEVARGSARSQERCKALGEQVFAYFTNQEPYSEALASPSIRELHTLMTVAPIVGRLDGRDKELILMHLAYVNPNQPTQAQ